MPKIKVNNPKNIIKGTPTRYYFKLHNTSGPKGDKGDTGATGAQGPKGDTGNAATIHVGSTTTLSVGQDATVENVGSQYAAVLNFGIPQGPQGPKGDKGDTGATGATGPQGATGAKGDPGQNATVYIGTTTTGAPGTQASVYNSGTENNAVLNFTIPQGAQGDLGPANTLSIGSVTKGADAGATITGDAPNQTLNLVLPKGDTGPTGPTGPQGPQGVPGVQGVPGKDFSIYKTYASVADMNADAANVPEGEFVMIASTTEDPDNAKLYVKNGEGTFTYLSDLSGAQGIQGPRGEQGVPGPQGIPGPTGPTGPRGSVKSQYVAELPASGDEDTFYLVDKDLESHTESGEYINFETTQTAAAIQSAQIDGNATQTGTPTPDAPVPISVVTGENVVKVVGKNLCSDVLTGTINWHETRVDYYGDEIKIAKLNTGGISANPHTQIQYTPLKQGQPYTLSMEYKNGTIIPGGSYGWVFYIYGVLADGTTSPQHRWQLSMSNTSATPPTASVTFTPAQDYIGFRLGCYIAPSTPTTDGDVYFGVQLEVGNQSTPYQAHTEQDYTISLGELELAKIGTYQDRIYKDGEKWYVEKNVGKVVLDGSEPWGYVTFNRGYFQCSYAISNIVSFDGNPATNAKCDYFTCASRYAVLNVADLLINLSETYCAISYDAYPKTAQGLADFKTWLSTHPTTVYYALATPTTTEITNQTLIDQLEALASATLNQGVNNIFTEIATGNAMPTLELNWVEWEKYNKHNVYIWNDDIDDWQVIVS